MLLGRHPDFGRVAAKRFEKKVPLKWAFFFRLWGAQQYISPHPRIRGFFHGEEVVLVGCSQSPSHRLQSLISSKPTSNRSKYSLRLLKPFHFPPNSPHTLRSPKPLEFRYASKASPYTLLPLTDLFLCINVILFDSICPSLEVATGLSGRTWPRPMTWGEGRTFLIVLA